MLKQPQKVEENRRILWRRKVAAYICRALDKTGYRDVFQDLLGVTDCEPDYVRTMLLRTLQYQFPDGTAVRQFEKFRGGGHDLRMYMDSPSWIPDILVRYIAETGDKAVLDKDVPFLDKATMQPDPRMSASVYDHALRAGSGRQNRCRL